MTIAHFGDCDNTKSIHIWQGSHFLLHVPSIDTKISGHRSSSPRLASACWLSQQHIVLKFRSHQVWCIWNDGCLVQWMTIWVPSSTNNQTNGICGTKVDHVMNCTELDSTDLNLNQVSLVWASSDTICQRLTLCPIALHGNLTLWEWCCIQHSSSKHSLPPIQPEEQRVIVVDWVVVSIKIKCGHWHRMLAKQPWVIFCPVWWSRQPHLGGSKFAAD